MTDIPILFTKCFYKKNITRELNNLTCFEKTEAKENTYETYDYSDFSDKSVYDLSFEKEVYGTFVGSKVFVYMDSYIFVSSQYLIKKENENKEVENLGKAAYRICHDKVGFPEDELLKKIFSSINEADVISFFIPDGYSVKRKDYKKDEFEKYYNYRSDETTNGLSFIFTYYELQKTLNDCSEWFLPNLKKAVNGNSIKSTFTNESVVSEIDSARKIVASEIGVCVLNENSSTNTTKNDDIKKLYHAFLKSIQEMIHFENKAKEFNREMDIGDYKNIDELNTSVRKEMRKAVHTKYQIKNSIRMNSRSSVFYGKYMESIKFDEKLDKFIDICISVEKELRAKIDEREELHDKHFDKILSVVAVFAIVSVFKDGSDLILSMVDSIKSRVFGINDIISIAAPALCAISIFVLLKMFKKK